MITDLDAPLPGREGAATVAPGYRSSHLLSRWLVGVLLLGLAAEMAFRGTDVLLALRYPDFLDPDREPASLGEVVIGLVLLVGFVVNLVVLVLRTVLFCVWIHHAHRNAGALGSRGMEFTPGWAVGWFFVPFANLYKPYQAVRETYLASDPDVDENDDRAMLSWHWSQRPVPVQMKLWWGTWILMNLLANVEFRASFRDDPTSRVVATWFGVAETAVAIPCTLLVVWLILEIEDRLARRHDRRRGLIASPPLEEPR
ncbi:MAG TPA: DUF4328 domain-containing protein [Vicinamibacteria bacterium]